MKTLAHLSRVLVCLAGLAGLSLSAADLTLADGRVLRDATITGQSASNVTVRHADGLAAIPKAVLPEALRTQYPVTQSPVSSPSSTSSGVAKAKADEAARIARAKARQAERAQWLKDNPQEHEVIYRVESKTPGTTISVATPEKGIRNFSPPFDSWGVYEEKFTARDGARLSVGIGNFGTDPRTGKFASTITVSILVDGSVVRTESLEPRSGSLDVAWVLGAAEQPEVARSGGSIKIDEPTGISRGTGRIIRKDPGFVLPDDWKP